MKGRIPTVSPCKVLGFVLHGRFPQTPGAWIFRSPHIWQPSFPLFPVGPTPWAIAPGMAPAPKREMGRISRISHQRGKVSRHRLAPAPDTGWARRRPQEPRLELVESRSTTASNKSSQPPCKANASLQALIYKVAEMDALVAGANARLFAWDNSRRRRIGASGGPSRATEIVSSNQSSSS